jgi:hypothetical protein
MARHCKTFCSLASTAGGLLVVAASDLCCIASARAYEEQVSLDVAPAYAHFADSEQLPSQGVGADVGAGFGVSDLGVLRASLGYLALLDGQRVYHAGSIRLEAVYLIDVLQLVPFIGVGGSLTIAQGSSATVSGLPGGHLVFGLDYLLSRSLILGLDARTGFLSEAAGLVSVSGVSVRLSRMFETF